MEHGDFVRTSISQGSVGTYSRNVGMFNYQFTANSLLSLSVKEFCKSIIICQSYEQNVVAPFFRTCCSVNTVHLQFFCCKFDVICEVCTSATN